MKDLETIWDNIPIMINLRIKLNFVKHLRIKISEKRLAQRFDVAMTSVIIKRQKKKKKTKTKKLTNIYETRRPTHV